MTFNFYLKYNHLPYSKRSSCVNLVHEDLNDF